jgi:hypothetical protein
MDFLVAMAARDDTSVVGVYDYIDIHGFGETLDKSRTLIPFDRLPRAFVEIPNNAAGVIVSSLAVFQNQVDDARRNTALLLPCRCVLGLHFGSPDDTCPYSSKSRANQFAIGVTVKKFADFTCRIHNTTRWVRA